MKTVGSPKASCASERADSSATSMSAGSRTTRIPRPPPPEDALSTTGKPSRSPCSSASSTLSTGPPFHGTTGTSASSAMRLDVTLSPRRRIVAALGPMKVIPASSQRWANDARSETKPHPTHTASTSAPVRALMSVSSSRYRTLRCPSVGVLERGRAQVHRLVGLAHEPRGGVGVGVQRDDGDALVRPPLQVQLRDGGEQAHGRLPAVDDGQPLDGCHPFSFYFAMTPASRAAWSSGRGLGVTTVQYWVMCATTVPSLFCTRQSNPSSVGRAVQVSGPASLGVP